MSDYNLPRWQILIDATLAELKGGMPVDRPALEKQWRNHDLKLAMTANGDFATEPHGDFFVLSRVLYKQKRAAGNRRFVSINPSALTQIQQQQPR